MKNHFIVCGAGDTGIYVIDELIQMGIKLIVIEYNEERLRQILETREFPYIKGDATDENVLHEAEIGSARGLCAALSADRDNLFLVITAKGLNPDLMVVSKAIEEGSRPKLLRAGADAVIIPEEIGVNRLISFLFTPGVISFLDEMLRLQTVTRFSETTIHPGSPLIGQTLSEADIPAKAGMTIVAIRDGETRRFIYNPAPNREFKPGDVLIVIGTQRQMEDLAEYTKDPFYLDHRVT
ncbi:TPA: TrkA family potassium uptake protein [Candidatus Poribacteria bacterium]|nr:TrkA family potassium uptake protein [Candidatus Poribacteria bacterium]